MGLDFIFIVISAMVAAGITWVYTNGIYDKKVSHYSTVIANVDKQNNELRRQINDAQLSLQIATNNPRTKELELKLQEFVEQRQQTVSTVSRVRAKIEQDYASHTLGQYLLTELEHISPSAKILEKQRLQDTQDVFRRIRHGIR